MLPPETLFCLLRHPQLLDGVSGVELISRFDASDFPTKFAAQARARAVCACVCVPLLALCGCACATASGAGDTPEAPARPPPAS